MPRKFRPYDLEQPILLSPNVRDWLPEDHLAFFISDLVDSLDLKDIYRVYLDKDGRGAPPYEPRMLVKLLLYAYCVGVFSSRQIERATYENLAFRALSADQHPDHDSLAAFRKRHLHALAGLFLQVLQLAQRAGLVKMGHVSLDGTKLKADASKHKAMSYDRMTDAEKKLQQEIDSLLKQAQNTDEAEETKHGKAKRGDRLPSELARRESRLKKIQEAKAALEQEAKERAEKEADEVRKKLEERATREEETGKKTPGRTPAMPDPETILPEPKAQRNFTDPESRMMKDGATKEFVQAYNAQIVVDDTAQIIVACGVTQQANDKQQLVPMLLLAIENTGEKPQKASEDAGYFSEANVTAPELAGIDLYVPPDRQKHGAVEVPEKETATASTSATEQMRQKLRTEAGKETYKMRKAIVEPVFGQIKEVRGFRRFSFRGMVSVGAEWLLVCLTHNILKIFRAGVRVFGGVASASRVCQAVLERCREWVCHFFLSALLIDSILRSKTTCAGKLYYWV